MEFDTELLLLSAEFIEAYPADEYPELMHKQKRPYTCLLIDTHYDYFICVPFRSSIGHKNAFMFKGTERSKKTKSGLDYSKSVIINKGDYLDSESHAVVDQDEYRELMKNLSTIVNEATDYVDTYVDHVMGNELLHDKTFERKYRYSTLPYFHKELGL